MDRRSWLWRRKSSEKSPNGSTESSGSISSEKFSDDQALSNPNTRSPEVTSRPLPSDEELNNDSLNTSLEKLSEAMIDIRAKEDLVKQHAKVAEEAVSGWERAENEVLVLKKQIDALTHKNLILEERVDHLDGALKECLRQLRQAREEQQEKIKEFESTKSQLNSKLEVLEKENSMLKKNLISKTQELESASRQNLENIKKIAELEVECQGQNAKRSLMEIDLMDDFLEMERMVNGNGEDFSRNEVEILINRTGKLEENLEKIESKKINLETALKECRIQLKNSEDRLEKTEVEFEFLNTSICSLEKEVEKERAFSSEVVLKCENLDNEISRMKLDCENQKSAIIEEFRINQDKELAVAASKFAECQETMASIDRQLKTLATLDDFLIDLEGPIEVQ